MQQGLFWLMCACAAPGADKDRKCVKSLQTLQLCARQKGCSLYSLSASADKILQLHAGAAHSERSRLFAYIVALKDLQEKAPPA